MSDNQQGHHAIEKGGFVIRAPVWGDLDAVLELIRSCEAVDEGEAESTADDLRTDWGLPGVDLSRSAARQRGGGVGWWNPSRTSPNQRPKAPGAAAAPAQPVLSAPKGQSKQRAQGQPLSLS